MKKSPITEHSDQFDILHHEIYRSMLETIAPHQFHIPYHANMKQTPPRGPTNLFSSYHHGHTLNSHLIKYIPPSPPHHKMLRKAKDANKADI